MTFYEAALQILLREGRPLHAKEITELALKENLLSHVGKEPESVMASRLASMARRSHDRRLVAVEADTFALTDWNVSADPEALAQSGILEEPEEGEALRPRERHPSIAKEKARIAGRGERRRKEEVERRRRRPLSLPSLVNEILDRMQVPVPLFDLAALIREHDLVSDDLGREALAKQLRSENSRREEEGHDALFTFPEGDLVGLSGWPTTTPEMFEVAPAVEEVVRQVAAERKPARPQAVAAPAAGQVEKLQAEYRQQAIRALRRRLLELDGGELDALTQHLLAAMGYRHIRIAKRNRDGALFTARRRMGLVEVRFAVQVLRGGRDVRREDVNELREDLSSHSAQVGVLLSAADPTREARSEASRPGKELVLLLCADALADQLAELGIGVSQQQVTLHTFDPAALGRLISGQEGRSRGREGRERRSRDEKRSRRGRRSEREEAEESAASSAEAKEEGERRGGRERQRRSRRGERGESKAKSEAQGEAQAAEGKGREESAAKGGEGATPARHPGQEAQREGKAEKGEASASGTAERTEAVSSSPAKDPSAEEKPSREPRDEGAPAKEGRRSEEDGRGGAKEGREPGAPAKEDRRSEGDGSGQAKEAKDAGAPSRGGRRDEGERGSQAKEAKEPSEQGAPSKETKGEAGTPPSSREPASEGQQGGQGAPAPDATQAPPPKPGS